mgnify:CR=1 FL=1
MLTLGDPDFQCVAEPATSATKTKTTTSSTARSTAACSAVYGQCGGSSFTGSTCCELISLVSYALNSLDPRRPAEPLADQSFCTGASGSSCVESNEWYSQCVPFAGLASTTTSSAATKTHKVSLAKKRSSSSDSTCAQLYYQCGGKNYGDGPTCCKSGLRAGHSDIADAMLSPFSRCLGVHLCQTERLL